MTYTVVCGQAIDNTQSFKYINQDRYLRYNFENDYFAAADCYYTGGMNLEIIAPWISKIPLSRILVHGADSYVRYGIGLENEMYTPTDIRKSDILYGNRPYAACLFLKTFVMSVDTVKKQRYTSVLSTGIIGPAAGAMDIQSFVHKVLPHNTVPKGWANQVHNDIILNYEVTYEKQFISIGRLFSLDAGGMLRAGTLSDKAAIGVTAMGCYFDSPFSTDITAGINFRVYAYAHPQVDIVGYDATMEGGLFDHTSPYTISPRNIRRFVFQNRYGIVLTFHKVYVEYFQVFISSEFSTGGTHKWGGIQVAVAL